MSRIQRKLLAIMDEVERLVVERRQVEDELSFHRLIDDDAQRDAAVSGLDVDRREAGSTSADVRRFERRLSAIDARLEKLEERRVKLTDRLA